MNSLTSYYLESAALALRQGNSELAKYELGTALSLSNRLGQRLTAGRILAALSYVRRIGG